MVPGISQQWHCDTIQLNLNSIQIFCLGSLSNQSKPEATMNEGNYDCKLARRGNELARMVLQSSFRQDKNMSRQKKKKICGITNFGSGEIF